MFCPKCGSENQEKNKFCKKCGKQLPNRAQGGQGVSQSFSLSNPSNLLGQVLDGKYRIESKLGSGGMGDVYRATRLLIGDSVAIKILHPHLAIDPQAAERFRREAVTATQLRHRNVVALFDVGISAAHNVPYILMELAEGFSLRQMINQYRVLPLDFVVTVAAQVCAALDEAHRLGIVHRDIKPENIIANQTTTGWQIKILDFGIAKLYNQADIGLTQDGSAMGTPQYMSPEQCMGEQLDGRSDLYSVGIVIYEMLCGTVPFKSATASAIAVFQVQNEPPSPRSIDPNIHPDIEAVILKSLEKTPDARQRTAVQFSQELIKAATTAFKSGMAEVSAAPIAAPDVEPEFDAGEDDDKPEFVHASIPDDESTDRPGDDNEQEIEHKIGEVVDGQQPEESALVLDEAESRLDEILPNSSFDETQAVDIPDLQASQPIAEPTESLSNLDEASRDLVDDSEPDDEVRAVTANQNQGVSQSVEDKAVTGTEVAASSENGDALSKRRALMFGGIGVVVLLLVVGSIAATMWLSRGLKEADVSAANTSNSNKQSDPKTPPPGMAYVPGGEFIMGSDTGDEYSRPAHKVTVKPFIMDITEVTNEEYKKFVDATNRKPPAVWKGTTFPDGQERFPVTGVTWDDANEFAKWAGKRLPTETEWEFAARGTDGRIYPWGKDWKPANANADNQTKGVREVGQGDGKSPFGMFDMVGNAWEWTAGDFVSYPGGKLPGQANGKKVIRGGCFLSRTDQATGTFRVGWPARGGNEYDNTSFRCAKDLPLTSQ